MIAIIVSLLALAIPAHAGQEVGNGGNVVVCGPSGPTQTVEPLDYYEARMELGLHLDLGAPELPVQQKVQLALERLGKLSPIRAWALSQRAETFLKDAVMLPCADLVPVDDSHHLAVPHGCSVVQIAIQKDSEFPLQKLYTINQDLWDRLDNDGKAGVILHEIIYWDARHAGAKDSVGSRYLNGLISSSEGLPNSLALFTEIARGVPLDYVEFDGHRFKVAEETPQFVGTGTFKGGLLYDIQQIKVGEWDSFVNALYYYDTGKVEEAMLQDPVVIDFGGYPLQFSGTLDFDRNGYPIRGTVPGKSVFKFESATYSLAPDSNGKDFRIGRASDGTITECGACQGWVTVGGRTFNVMGDSTHERESFDFFQAEEAAERDFGLVLSAPTAFNVVQQGLQAQFIGPVAFDTGGPPYDFTNLEVSWGDLAQPTVLPVGARPGLQATFAGRVRFNAANGRIEHGVLATAAQLGDENGNVGAYPAGTEVKFDRGGNLVFAQSPK